MIYANPAAAEFASGQYYGAIGSEYYLWPAKLQSDYADVRFDRELRLFRKHCAGGAVLDVGCSNGAFLFQLNQRFPGGYEVLGTDVSGAALDYAESRGVPVVRGNFTEQALGGKSFDALTFWAVKHLNYFTQATLTKLVETRFSAIEFRSTHFNPLVIWQDWRRGGVEISNRQRAELLKRTTSYKQNRWLGPVRASYHLAEKTLGALNLADNLVAVLRKKS